jgi:hypothetical protein
MSIRHTKSKTVLQTLMALILAVFLCLSGVTAAFAEDVIVGTEGDEPEVVITKALKIPSGTTVPTGGFNFSFDIDAVSVDGVDATTTNMPVIPDATIAITSAAAGSGTTASGVTTTTKESSNILSGVTWPHPGVYVYEIAEVASGAFADDGDATTTETLTYSGARYTLTAWVSQGTSLYISAIAVVVDDKDNGGQGANAKVDPTPGKGGLLFTNVYTRIKNDTNPMDGGVLDISNSVATGGYGDTTLYFPYTITLASPDFSGFSHYTPATDYKGYVVEGGAVVTSTDNSSTVQPADSIGTYVLFPASGTTSINLKHGQTLVFLDLLTGTTWTAVDSLGASAPLANYIASGKRTVNGVGPTDLATVSAGQPLSTEAQSLGEKTNAAAFTNTYSTPTPTGIAVRGFPYVGLIVLAALALGVFVAFRVHRAKKRQQD